MSVHDRQVKKAIAARGGLIDLHAGLDQCQGRLYVATPYGKQDRRHALRPIGPNRSPRHAADIDSLGKRGPGVDIRSVADQQLHDLGVPFSCRPHSRYLASPGFLRIHVGAAIDQQLHDICTADASGGHEGRLAFRLEGVRIGARIQIVPRQ